MSDIKVLTNSDEASKYELDPKYVTVDIVKDGDSKYAIFRLKEEPKEVKTEKVKVSK